MSCGDAGGKGLSKQEWFNGQEDSIFEKAACEKPFTVACGPTAPREACDGEGWLCAIHYRPCGQDAGGGLEAHVAANRMWPCKGDLAVVADEGCAGGSELFLACTERNGLFLAECGLDNSNEEVLLRDGELCRLTLDGQGGEQGTHAGRAHRSHSGRVPPTHRASPAPIRQRQWRNHMLNESRIKEAVELFCKNDYWNDFYRQAPSSACRRRVALDYYYSAFHNDADFKLREYDAEIKMLESQFGLDDWKHMLKYSGNNPLRAKYMRKISEIENK